MSHLTIIDGIRFVPVTTKMSDGSFNADVVVGECDNCGNVTRIMSAHRAGDGFDTRTEAKSRAREKRDELVKRHINGDVLQ